MPFAEVDFKKKIEDMRESDPEFKDAWDSSCEEYNKQKRTNRQNEKKRRKDNCTARDQCWN